MEWLGKGVLFIGRDMELFQSMQSMPWLMQRVDRCFHEPPALLDDALAAPVVFNAGIIGGHRDTLLEFLDLVVTYLKQTNPEVRCGTTW